MGCPVKDAHLHIDFEESKTEKLYLVRYFAFGAVRARRLVMRYVAVTPVRLNGPACWHALRERSSQPAGYLLVSPIHSERADLT